MKELADMGQLIQDPNNLKEISQEVLDRVAGVEPLRDVQAELKQL